MTHPTKLVAALATTLLLTLAACGGDSSPDAAPPEQTAANGDVFNDADVAFATAMIPHHAQALVMVDLTRGHHLSPAVEKLTEEIRATQGAQIEQMAGWLTDWDQPVPATMRDHANAEGHGTDGSGAGNADGMDELASTRGAEFESLLLRMMISHHEDAIEAAGDEQRDGAFGPAVELAESIERSQQAEIDRMQDLLAP